MSPVISNPTITVIGDDESAGQALALAINQEASDSQPISNLILINRLPKVTEEGFCN